jgi:hypothetical protein
MTITKRAILAAACFVLLSACSAHNPLIVTNQTQSSLVDQTHYAPSQDKVFVTEQTLPAGVEFNLIGTIDVGKVWYGSSQDVLTSMADRARELGANAIIQTKTWYQPSGFSWAAPHGSGQAVRVQDVSTLASRGVSGDWH